MPITTRPDILSASTTYPFAAASTTFATCTWTGHCLGAACSTYNDCDNDWICSNNICSPCCEPLSTSSATALPTLTPSQPASKGGLNTAAAIGIGVGGVVLVVTCMAVGFWLCHGRRKRRILVEAPDTRHTKSELDGTDHFTANGERKHLFATSTAELPSPAAPMELHSVELVELEGSSASKRAHQDGEDVSADSNDAEGDCFPPHPDQIATLRSHQARFEEYALSPSYLTPRQWAFSPVVSEEQFYPPLSETSMISGCNPHRRASSSEQNALRGGPYLSLRDKTLASSYMSNPRPGQTRTVALGNPIQSMQATPSPELSSPIPDNRSRRFHHPFQSHSSSGEDGTFVGSEETP